MAVRDRGKCNELVDGRAKGTRISLSGWLKRRQCRVGNFLIIMNIIIVGPTFPFKGGIAHYTTLLCEHLRKKHQVKFFAFKRSYPGLLYPGNPEYDKSRMKLSVDDAVSMVDWANPISWVRTAHAITELSPDIVIFPWWMWGWAIPFWTIARLSRNRGRTKVLYICHNVVEHESNIWKHYLSKLALMVGDIYFVHSRNDYERLRKLFPRAVIKLNFHPTYEFFRHEQVTRDEARCRLGIDRKFKKVLLFFGIVRPYKGLRYLIEAMPEVLKELPDLCLVIAGEFWQEKNQIAKLIDRLGICGNVLVRDEYIPNEDVSTIFSACDLVVLPYVAATGSGVTQIAFGFNKPVVATATGDLPSVVADGRRGFVVPPMSSSQLAKAIIRCFREEVLKDFVRNISSDRFLFSWEHLTSSIEHAFART